MIPNSISTITAHLNLCILTLFLLSRTSFGIDHPYYEACAPRNCGQGNNRISYPFYIRGQQEPYCGFPGFELNCTENGTARIRISENDYIVEEIRYNNQSFRVSNAAVSSNSAAGCFPRIRNVTFETNSVFSLGNVSNLVLFSDCQERLSERLMSYTNIGCNVSSRAANSSLAMLENDGNIGLAEAECEEKVVAPVELYGGDGRNRTGGWNYYRELLRRGFLLNWTASDCSVCAASGGRCGLNSTSLHFMCLCRDRPHSRRCKPNQNPNSEVERNSEMILAFFLALCFPFLLSLLNCAAAQGTINSQSICPNFRCRDLGFFGFPFYDSMDPRCGLCRLICNETVPLPVIQLAPEDNRFYDVLTKQQNDSLFIRDEEFQNLLRTNSCDAINHLTFPNSPSISYSFFPPLTIFKCNNSPEVANLTERHFDGSYHRYRDCEYSNLYYRYPANFADTSDQNNFPHQCSIVQLPHTPQGMLPPGINKTDLFRILASEFTLTIQISEDCLSCHYKGGLCQKEGQEFHCVYLATKGKRNVKPIIAAAVGSALIITICVACIIIRRRYKWRSISSYISSKNSPQDLESASVHYGVPVFSYSELEEATHKFDPSKELGDGGFGAVYYGKLRDGREVAVKRLYEHNFKRVEQFMNEVEILTLLRHPNLVLLYGCTSHRSRELLLVYEYIPNGTVADHLHGDRAKSSPLTWPIRMNIAVETASALAYLHASDVIHRDVKSNNILLDENYCVKVADFGLSRLFPNDVSHVSTAPQGTPGYVDPEYHQCYQLTDKSDVYSFGVVLVELISSMPAVDISRHRHEINLSNLAINRIQKCAFDELIDPSLGYGSNESVNRMTTSVAELAFRCLQFDKEMRPAMDEVLAVLREIQVEVTKETTDTTEESKSVKPPPSPESEDVVLLKNVRFPPSPISVTGKWHSGSSTTPYTSG